MNGPKPDVVLRGADPMKTFFITGDVHLDGSVDVETEGPSPQSFDAALALATKIVDEHGDAMFVIECRCVRKVMRGRTRVVPIKTKGAM